MFACKNLANCHLHQLGIYGFALTELLLVLALLAGIATATAPALGAWLVRERIRVQARALLATFSYARSEAIKQGRPITICRYDGTGHCSYSAQTCLSNTKTAANDWSCGYMVLVKSLPSTVQKNARQILRIQPPIAGVIMKGGATHLTFTPPAGQIIGGFRNFDLSARATIGMHKDQVHRCVRIAAGGRARIIHGPCRAAR